MMSVARLIVTAPPSSLENQAKSVKMNSARKKKNAQFFQRCKLIQGRGSTHKTYDEHISL
jgi:hypothetical protein